MSQYGQIGLNINLLNSGNANLWTPIYYLETAPNSLIGSQALYQNNQIFYCKYNRPLSINQYSNSFTFQCMIIAPDLVQTYVVTKALTKLNQTTSSSSVSSCRLLIFTSGWSGINTVIIIIYTTSHHISFKTHWGKFLSLD